MSRLKLRLEEVEVDSFATGVDEMRVDGPLDAIATGANPVCTTRLTVCPCTPRAAG